MAHRRRVALALGLGLGALSFLPPVMAVADQRLFLHVLQEMLLLAAVAPLITYGASPLLGRHLAYRWQPLIGILALNAVLFAAQLPALVNLVGRYQLVHAAVQAVFILGAFLFWLPILRPGTDRGGLSPIAKVGYLMVASVPPTIPGITLAFSHHLFYSAYGSIEDQQFAGLLLFATAKCALVTGTFVILWRLLTPDADPPDDDADRRTGPDVPAPAPAWFARLGERLPSEPARERMPVSVR
ncbi:MAG: cytochrome c oxidase assembly protein [Candidatus Dormibacteraeota bacterium]|nr:cytochrome c oxidase assembly protein [Candidatus Dormibacteraeota bacterium]